MGWGGGQEVTLAFSLQDKTPGLTQPSRLTRARPSECHSLPSRLTLLTFVDVTFFFSPWMVFQTGSASGAEKEQCVVLGFCG